MKIKLEKYLFGDAMNIPIEPGIKTEFTSEDYHDGYLLRKIYAEVMGHPLVDIEEKYPADWWQALKERWAPKWLLEKYPVQYKIISIQAAELLAKRKFPEEVTWMKREVFFESE